MKEIRLGVPFPGVILSPEGRCCVSQEDLPLIRSKGLAVVDCSWNKLDDVPFSEYAWPWLHCTLDFRGHRLNTFSATDAQAIATK